jgi:hypothetical protein
LLSPKQVHAINRMNVQSLRSKKSADDIYLSNNGPQTFEPLPNPAKQIN